MIAFPLYVLIGDKDDNGQKNKDGSQNYIRRNFEQVGFFRVLLGHYILSSELYFFFCKNVDIPNTSANSIP